MKFVISLGGSIINPGKINTPVLKKFCDLILQRVQEGDQFFIVTGGGAIARVYQRALRELARVSQDELDWIGIAATKMNAQFILSLFGKKARKKLITDPTEKKRDLKPVNIASGWKPGRSTDYVAVRLAHLYGVKAVINLTDVDYVYNRDPRKNKQVKRIEKMNWKQYIARFGTRWDPGANVPFDPVAAQFAAKHKIAVMIMHGKNLKNFANYFSKEQKVKGTLIT